MNTASTSHVCASCGQIYYKRQVTSRLTWSKSKFCSRKCTNKNRVPYNKGKKMAEICPQYKHWATGKEVSYDMRQRLSMALKGHESNENQKIALAKGKEKLQDRWLRDRITKYCLICSKAMVLSPSTANKKTCSMQCYGKYQSEYHRGKLGHAYINGESTSPYPKEFNDELRDLIRSRDSHQCQICQTKQNGHRLPIHHINYDKNNNTESNLITLCIPCHAKTNINRDYWRKYFG